MKLKECFNQFTSNNEAEYLSELTYDQQMELGKLLFHYGDNNLRAEALIECPEFDKYSVDIFEDPMVWVRYKEGIFKWLLKCFEDEYDDFITDLKYENRNTFDADY